MFPGGILGVFAFGATLTGVRVFCFQVGGERVIRRLRRRLLSLIMSQPMTFFDYTEPGELLSRLSSDCELLRNTLTVSLVLSCRFAIQVLGGVALLFYISWSLTLVLVAVLPLLAVVGAFYSRRASVLGKSLQNSIAESTSLATEVLSSVRHVRAFDQESFEVARYTSRLDKTFDVARRLAIASSIFLGGTELGSYIAVIGVLLYATFLVSNGSLSLEFITSFVLYSVYVAHAVGALSHQTADVSRAVGASERVFTLLNIIAAVVPTTVSHGKQRRGQLRGGH